MRLDKFLKTSGLIKRRTVAKEACDGGRIKINGRTARSAHEVRVGDVVQISLGRRTLEVEVVQVPEGQIRKEEMAGLYRVRREEVQEGEDF
jgi:ribosomal 50S subunit-recycling heat shock protein